METNKKLQLVTEMVDEFNLSVYDVVSYWITSRRLNLDASTLSSQALSSGKYETPKIVLPGMYVYADGLIYPKIIEGRQIIAVVGSVTYPEVLAVCLHEACLPWFSNWMKVNETQTVMNGQEATRKILDTARCTGEKAEAAQWCYEYDKDGVTKGEAFLPSMAELQKLFTNIAMINASLKVLGVELMVGYHWSSIEYSYDGALIMDMSSGLRESHLKTCNRSVRPIIKIQL